MKIVILFSLLPFACAPALSPRPAVVACPAPLSPTVATIGADAISQRELDDTVALQLYEVRQGALEQLIAERLLDSAAKAAKASARDWLRREVERRVPEVSTAEARDFYDKNKDALPAAMAHQSWDELKPTLIDALTTERRKHAAVEVVEELKKKANVKLLLAAPHVEVAATGPSRGKADAKITIVEFSDFQCPYCARAQPVLEQLLKRYDGKVRLIYRDFPLPFHEHAEKAAEAGQCAHEQGKFWPLHDWMFDHQDSLDDKSLGQAALQLGLDGARFDQCLSSGKFQRVVGDSQSAGSKVGVTGTPAFFVNGELLSGAQPFEQFQSVIERQLGQ